MESKSTYYLLEVIHKVSAEMSWGWPGGKGGFGLIPRRPEERGAGWSIKWFAKNPASGIYDATGVIVFSTHPPLKKLIEKLDSYLTTANRQAVCSGDLQSHVASAA
jgi:hypothetical protein